MYRVLAHHQKEYEREPEVVVDVPGVMTILGAYSDYCSGHALMCTSPEGLRLAVSRRDDTLVKVYNHTMQDRKKFQLVGLKCKAEDKWIGAVKAIFLALQHDGINLPGMDISITGRTAHSDYDTLSASVAAGFLVAFNSLFDLKMDKNDMLRLAHMAAGHSNGTCRLRDLMTLFIINEGEVVLFDLENYSYEVMKDPFEGMLSTYILDCGIPKNILYESEHSVMEDTKSAMETLRNKIAVGAHLRDYSTRELKYQRGLLGEDKLRYCEFTLNESQLALKAWDALKNKDVTLFCKCLAEQQNGIYEDLEVTCPEVEWLIKRNGENPHVYGSSLISTGSSGQILVVGENDLKEYYDERLTEYERIFDFHAALRKFCPAGGVRILDDDDITGK